MQRILLIVASGKSSRFGGFPKAFCNIGDKTNADNTISLARCCFDKVYIGVNSSTYEQFSDKIKGCEMFSIKTGQGDAHSVLKCLRYVRSKEPELKRITVCWGDAVFVDSTPFKQLLKAEDKVAVACSKDEKPYAWFDVDEQMNIIKSHFAKEEGFKDVGWHDQSLFSFDFAYALDYLNRFRELLGISDDNDERYSDVNEMKLLFSFEYLRSMGKPAKCIPIDCGNVLSFNTQDELEAIKSIIIKE